MLKPVLNGINQYLTVEVCTEEKSLIFWFLKMMKF